jgi:curved DNA-binding protein CbpA
MAASQRPGEITYYEALGVSSSASADEIRDAFRLLVRLLHPDQQSDLQLREAAELQMRKLNRIYAVLSDPARRAAYDESLDAPVNSPVVVFNHSDAARRKLILRGSAAGALTFGAFLLIWFMATSNNIEGRGQEARASTSGEATGNDAGDQISRLREQLRSAETERDAALDQLGRPGAKPALLSKTPKPAIPRISEAAAAFPVASVTASSEPAIPATEFAGMWVYSRAGSASSASKSQYPPEFIEVTVTETNGSLHGQYHSRYQVLDHGSSPDVDFTFNGTPAGSALNCAWQGPGGAKGRMTLTLLPAKTVELAWNATELGSQQWFTNGTATLVRKQ